MWYPATFAVLYAPLTVASGFIIAHMVRDSTVTRLQLRPAWIQSLTSVIAATAWAVTWAEDLDKDPYVYVGTGDPNVPGNYDRDTKTEYVTRWIIEGAFLAAFYIFYLVHIEWYLLRYALPKQERDEEMDDDEDDEEAPFKSIGTQTMARKRGPNSPSPSPLGKAKAPASAEGGSEKDKDDEKSKDDAKSKDEEKPDDEEKPNEEEKKDDGMEVME